LRKPASEEYAIAHKEFLMTVETVPTANDQNRTTLIFVALWLLLSPLAIAVFLDSNMDSPFFFSWLWINVLPLTASAVLGWVFVQRVVIGQQGARWWVLALRIVAWLVVAPVLFTIAIGGDMLTLSNFFRVAPYATLGGAGLLVAWAVVVWLARRKNLLRPTLRRLAVGALVAVPFVVQVVLFPLMAMAVNKAQMAYCEWAIVPQIEAYEQQHDMPPNRLADAVSPYTAIPPDVVYADYSLRIEDRSDFMGDYVYRARGNWVYTD
jgi:hypothetical protein